MTLTDLDLLVDLLDRGYDRQSWHGPNLRGSIRGLDATAAAWRPRSDRHSIAEQVLHAAYWKYTVRRRITGEKRGSFPLEGSNWFPVPASLSPAEWKRHVQLLDEQHKLLRFTVATLKPANLTRMLGKMPLIRVVTGVAFHDVYHAGQIQLLKRLHSSDRKRS